MVYAKDYCIDVIDRQQFYKIVAVYRAANY